MQSQFTTMNVFHKLILSIAFILVTLATQAQLKVGNNPTIINPSSMLEIESTNKGLLLPRVALSNTTTATLVGGSHVAGMMVYNTATTGNVTPGYYCNDGIKWVRLADAAAITTQPWFNVATNSAATANTQNIYQLGNIGIGTTAPLYNLHVSNQADTTKDVDIVARPTNVTGKADIRVMNGIGKQVDLSMFPSNKTGLRTGTIPYANLGIMYTDADNFGIENPGSAYIQTGSNVILNPGVAVGIGTFTPSNKLDVNGTVRVRSIASGAATDSVLTVSETGVLNKRSLNGVLSTAKNIYNSNGTLAGNRTVTQGANTLNFTGTGVTTFNSGNVGIGTTAPTQKLNVNGGNLDIDNSTNPLIRLHSIANDTIGGGQIEFNENSLGYGIRLRHLTSPSSMFSEGLHIETKSVGAYSPFVSFDQNTQRVGIGTTKPLTKLHVNGNAVIGIQTAATDGARSIGANILNVVTPTKLDSTNITAPETALRLIRAGTTLVNFNAVADFQLGTYAPTSAGYTANTNLKIRLSQGGSTYFPNVDVMTLQGNGNVGIGTTTPTSKLQVVGLPIYANNAAALTGGLTVGAFYHAGDGIVRVVF